MGRFHLYELSSTLTRQRDIFFLETNFWFDVMKFLTFLGLVCATILARVESHLEPYIINPSLNIITKEMRQRGMSGSLNKASLGLIEDSVSKSKRQNGMSGSLNKASLGLMEDSISMSKRQKGMLGSLNKASLGLMEDSVSKSKRQNGMSGSLNKASLGLMDDSVSKSMRQ